MDHDGRDPFTGPPETGDSPTPDLLIRAAGAVMVFSGFFNALTCAFWVLSLIWVLVGLLWLIPMLEALVEIGVGGWMVISGRRARRGALLPIAGCVTSLVGFNLVTLMLQLLASGLGVAGYLSSRPQELSAR